MVLNLTALTPTRRLRPLSKPTKPASMAITMALDVGGFSSNRETLVELPLQPKPSSEELVEFDELAKKAGITPADEWWLSESGTQVVLNRMQPHITRLKQKAVGATCRMPHE